MEEGDPLEESVVTIGHMWLLAVAWLPLAWMLFEWRRTARKVGLALKALSLVAILLALADPRLILQETKIALAVLVDTSASSSPGDLERASKLAQEMAGARGRHSMRVIPFARSTRELSASEEKNFRLTPTSGEPGRATDLEGAVRDAIAALPAGMVPRIALISDGRENQGSIARAAWQAQQLGIPIDTFALAGHLKPALRLESVSLPSMEFTGEQFAIDLTVSSPDAGPAEVELSAEGKPIGHTQVNLARGANPVRLHASLNTAGALDISVAIKAGALGEVHFDQAMVLRQPKVLYISTDDAAQGAPLLATLASAQFDVTLSNNLAQPHLDDFQLVILNNCDLEAFPLNGQQAVEQYVKRGGGLLVIAGERNLYRENKTEEDPLERALPAKLAPPRSPEGTAVVLIVDKSSSMEGRKIDLARRAAMGVVDHLRPVDQVGVLIFDNSFEWAVPIRRADDKALLKRLIGGITPDGGTQIAPALAEAYRRIRPVNATYKHIVLLTDGISEEGDSVSLAKEAEAQKVTISTVGLGQDVNRSYLERVAATAGGKSYFLTEFQGLEQLLLRDVLEHTGTTMVERPLAPEVLKHAEILNDVGMESAPMLKGYVRFTARPTAETILQLDRHDPLLARWQYGLGRSAVFASDAKGRWAAEWVAWKSFDKFWSNVFRDLLPRAQGGEAVVSYDSANGDLVAEYRLGRGVPEPETIPDVYAFGPGGFQQQIPVQKIAAGTFRGRLPIGSRQGLFRVRTAAESRAFPEAGLYRPEAELADYGSNEELLKQIAAFTGGRFQPEPAAVFSGGGKSIATSLQLWPGLLGMAVLLSLAELVMRKWKGVMAAA